MATVYTLLVNPVEVYEKSALDDVGELDQSSPSGMVMTQVAVLSPTGTLGPREGGLRCRD